MNSEFADRIRERAYLIWEREGRPHGRDLEHWHRAEAELAGMAAPAGAAAAGKARTRGRRAAR